MISAIILPIGTAPQTGSPALFPKREEKIFLGDMVKVLHSARIMNIVIVVNDKEKKATGYIDGFEGKIISNPLQKTRQPSSIHVGLDNIPQDDLHGVMVCHIDHPLLTQKLLVNLLQGFWQSKKNIIIPKYDGARGQPIIFGAKLFDALRTEDMAGVIRNNADEIQEVQTEEQGTILRITSMEEYNKYSGVLKNA
jgi:CTP:molybdopterin cytidylyltransferase MocA